MVNLGVYIYHPRIYSADGIFFRSQNRTWTILRLRLRRRERRKSNPSPSSTGARSQCDRTRKPPSSEGLTYIANLFFYDELQTGDRVNSTLELNQVSIYMRIYDFVCNNLTYFADNLHFITTIFNEWIIYWHLCLFSPIKN